MTVILKIVDVPLMSQGWTGALDVKLENSGDENVKQVKIKVVDSVIFTDIKVYDGGGYRTCLNVFNTNWVENRDDGNYNFPAGTEKKIRLLPTIKDDAPVEVHDVETHFQFVGY